VNTPVRRPTAPLLSTRTAQIVLGGAWLLDGLLQLQPRMFTQAFVTQVLQPSAQGQPHWLGSLVNANARFVATDVRGWNAVFAAAQLLIGAGLVMRATVKPALVLSFVWSAGVWVLGEGCGMLLTGHASALTGAPGAVLLYAVIGIVAWPGQPSTAPVTRGRSREVRGRLVWAVVWVLFAGLWLLPGNTKRGSIGAAISAMGAGQPGWLAHLETSVGRLFSASGMPDTVALAIVSLIIGLGPLVVRPGNPFFVAGAALSLTFWVFGQAFGGVLVGPSSGTATDPNAGPLLAFLAVALVNVDVAGWCSAAGPVDETASIPAVGALGAVSGVATA